MFLVAHVINLKESQIIISVPVISVHKIYWGLGSLCLPFLGFTSPHNMAGLVTLVTFFLFERTTFMIMISRTAVATLIFGGWGTFFL